jgi:hypothetical protein
MSAERGLAAFIRPQACQACRRVSEGVEHVDLRLGDETGVLPMCRRCRRVWFSGGEAR